MTQFAPSNLRTLALETQCYIQIVKYGKKNIDDLYQQIFSYSTTLVHGDHGK